MLPILTQLNSSLSMSTPIPKNCKIYGPLVVSYFLYYIEIISIEYDLLYIYLSVAIIFMKLFTTLDVASFQSLY